MVPTAGLMLQVTAAEKFVATNCRVPPIATAVELALTVGGFTSGGVGVGVLLPPPQPDVPIKSPQVSNAQPSRIAQVFAIMPEPLCMNLLRLDAGKPHLRFYAVPARFIQSSGTSVTLDAGSASRVFGRDKHLYSQIVAGSRPGPLS